MTDGGTTGRRDGMGISLTRQQRIIFERLLAAQGDTVGHIALLSHCGSTGDTGTITAEVNMIRKRLARSSEPYRIDTVRGVGYRLVSVPDLEA